MKIAGGLGVAAIHCSSMVMLLARGSQATASDPRAVYQHFIM